MLAFIAASLFAPVSNSSAEQQVLAEISDGNYSISVSGSGTVNLDIGQPSSAGKLVKAADALSIQANAPQGYKLYVSMDNALAGGNRLYRGGVTTDAFLSPNKNSGGTDIAYGSEAALANNSWGFTTDTTKYNNNQFAAMPLSNNLALISQANVSGNYTQNVYYGVNANIDMVAGNYSGNIVYTITSDSIADTSGIHSVNPSTVSTAGGESVEITVALFSTAGISTVADLGDITVTIGGNNCPVTNKTLSGNNVVITCTTPAGTAGTKTIAVTIQKFGQTYEGEITYETPADPMQSFTASDCANLATSTLSSPVTVVLKDTRDNTRYRVSKLADGNCWMVDNLALDGTIDGTTPRTLTPADSDVTSNYTFPSGVDISVGTSSKYSPAQIVTRDKNNTDNGNKYGNYYNYLAATAGWGTQSVTSGDTPSSVCPKGWKLPAYSGDQSFQKLGSQYGITSSNVFTTIRNAPLYFPAAGDYYSGVRDQGSNGYYWSRRVVGANNAYYLLFYSGGYYPQYGSNHYRYSGFSVRCVFEPSMQEFTAQDCADLTLSTSSVDNHKLLRDARDNTKYRVSKLADGNCWMVDNLALNGTTDGTTPRTLTTSDSDVTSNYTFPSGVDISVGTSPVDTTPQIVTRDKENTDNNIKYGNYYNFLAATAGWGTTSISSGDSPQSICPKGWKLPAYSGDKSFQNLGSQYGLSNSNVWGTIRSAPLYFPAAGYYYYSGVSNQGSYGLYWSRRVSSANYAYNLYFYSGFYRPQYNSYTKSDGTSVRCVFGG